MHGHERILTLPPHPRTTTALLAWMFGHSIVLLKDLMDAVVADGEIITNAQNVGDRNSSHAERFVDLKNAFFETGWLVGVGRPSGCFEFGNFIVFTVVFGELLDPTAADLELLSHELHVSS